MLRFQGLAFFFLATLVPQCALALPNEWSSGSLSWMWIPTAQGIPSGTSLVSRAVCLSMDALQTPIDKVDFSYHGLRHVFGRQDIALWRTGWRIRQRVNVCRAVPFPNISNPQSRSSTPSFLISTKDYRPQKNNDRVF